MRWCVKGAWAAPVLAAVTLAAGCGSSSSSSSTVSKADFVAKANAICDKINTQIGALPKITSAQDLLTTGPKEIAVAKQGITELKALEVPDSLKDEATKYLAALDQETAISGKLVDAFKKKDAQALGQAEAAAKTNQAADHSGAVALGLTSCAKQVQPSGS
jgi:hypothetical protein